MSADKQLARHIEWLESLQLKRQQHLEKLAAVISKRQLEIDNLKARQENDSTT